MSQPLRHPPARTLTEQKARYQAFQAAGQRIAESFAGTRLEMKVPDHPEVLLTEGGAFVEARIWVPESEIQPELAGDAEKPGVLG